ncbi:hypothetical protein [Streptomyces virginiae]|uniref:hypothetical protein n=1 Tax=Streptomyces virginiae TaxID=1961 RepID=UPI0037BB6BDA
MASGPAELARLVATVAEAAEVTVLPGGGVDVGAGGRPDHRRLLARRGRSRRQGPSDVAELQPRLAVKRDRLPEIERLANRVVGRKAGLAERQAAEFRGIAQKHTTAVGRLQEEKALRLRMATEAPAQHATEVQQRAAYIKHARQQAAVHARGNAQRAQSEYRYQAPAQGRSGPSLGR